MDDSQEDVCLLRPGIKYEKSRSISGDSTHRQHTPVRRPSHMMALTPMRPPVRTVNEFSDVTDAFNATRKNERRDSLFQSYYNSVDTQFFKSEPVSLKTSNPPHYLASDLRRKVQPPTSSSRSTVRTEAPLSIYNNTDSRTRNYINSDATRNLKTDTRVVDPRNQIKELPTSKSGQLDESIEERFKIFEVKSTTDFENSETSAPTLTNFDHLRPIFSQCLLHDEKFLNLDKTILLPGQYQSVNKLFFTNPDIIDTPEELKQAAQNPSDFICGHASMFSTGLGETCYIFGNGLLPINPYVRFFFLLNNGAVTFELDSSVTAIGSLDIDSLSNDNHLPEELTIASKLLLIANKTSIVLWRLHSDPVSSVITAAPTSFSQPVDTKITCIIGHMSSKRFFYGDNYGTIREFVFGSIDQMKHMKLSISNRISSWSNTSQVKTQVVIGCSTIAHYLGQWAGGRKSIEKLIIDENRGLLYSLNVDSMIEIFGIFPPSITEHQVIENNLQLLVSATYNQILFQSSVIFSGATKQIEEIKAMQKLKIVDLKPLGRHEGSNVIAVAVISDGTRLFLECRFETPLSLKNISHTNNPEISKYQYLKAISLASWKPAPENFRKSNLLSDFYNSYTYAYGYDKSLLFMTIDESNVLEKQFNEPSRLLSEQMQYHEWTQEIPLQTRVIDIYEEPLEPLYKQLLDGYGCFPDPYEVAERYHMARITNFYESIKSKSVTDVSSESVNVFEETTNHLFHRQNSSVWYIPRYEQYSIPTRNEHISHISPSKLINSSATQVIPGRSFVILTVDHVYCINQNRIFDLLTLTASEILSMDPSNRSTMIQLILAHDVVSSANSTSMKYIELLNSTPSSMYSIANLSQLSQLYTPEQVMSVCWQILTYTQGNIKWPSSLEQTMHAHIKTFQNFLKPDNLQNRLLTRKTKKDRNYSTSVIFILELILHYITHYSFKSTGPSDPFYITPLNDVSSIYSTQIKGLLLYFSRLMRPVWSLPIFEPILISNVPYESLNKLPALYRKIEITDKSNSDKKNEANDSTFKRIKRFFTRESRLDENKKNSPTLIALGCRFQIAEIEKLQKWLSQLSETIYEVVKRILQNEKQHTSNKKMNWNARLENEISKSIQSCATIASEILMCVLYIMSIKEFKELPASAFDVLAQASLQDLLFVKEYQQELVKLLSLHVIQPSFILQNCPHLFRPDMLNFQLTVQTLVTLHRQFVQPNWCAHTINENLNPVLNTSTTLQTPSIQNAIKKILAVACQPESTIELEYLSIATLLFELQLFEILALFICNLSQAFLSAVPFAEHPNLYSDIPYKQNMYFTECRARYYHIIECILDFYLKTYEKSGAGQPIAERFVVACFHVPVVNSKTDWNTKSTLRLSREWFHNVLLDWIHSDGRQTFPIPLSKVMSPVYSSWVSVHKHDLGPESANVLSEFFLSNHKYDEFIEFFAGISKKPWTDPSQFIKENQVIPNGVPITDTTGLERFCSAMDLKCHVCDGLKIHSTSLDIHRLSALQSYWNFVFKYVETTQHGLSLGYRQSYLLQARSSLESLLVEAKTIEQRNAINDAMKPLLQLLNLVQIQLSLVRQAMESAVYLFFSCKDISKEIKNTFSENFSVRQQTLERMKKNDTQISQYYQVQNIQSLLYMLQWKLYENPSDLLQLIKEFAEASKNQVLVPGIDLCVEPSLKSLLPNISSSGISKQFLIYSAIACRGDLACWLKAPQILNDIVIVLHKLNEFQTAKYLTMLFICRIPSNDLSSYTSIFEDLLLFVPIVLNVLHEASATFQKILPPSPAEISSNNFDWDINYWMWPLIIIKDELNMVDNTISWNEDQQIEGQQKLPFLQALTDAYQQMYDTHEQGNFRYLKKSHLLVLLLDVQDYWIQQLISMCANLPYIHLLSDRFNEKRFSQEETSSVVNCLNEMFRGSPHKMQKLSVKAMALTKACDAVINRTSNWFSQHEEHILNTSDVHVLDLLKQITQNFLNNLEILESTMNYAYKYVSLLDYTQKYPSKTRNVTPLRNRLQIT